MVSNLLGLSCLRFALNLAKEYMINIYIMTVQGAPKRRQINLFFLANEFELVLICDMLSVNYVATLSLLKSRSNY